MPGLVRGKSVEITEEMIAAMEAEPDVNTGPAKMQWTKEMDDFLLRFWTSKGQDKVSKALGTSCNTARERYRYLIKEQENG